MKRIFLLLFVTVLTCFGGKLSAQDWAIKTNLAYDATTTMNLGFEVGVAKKWTLDFSGNYNPFTINKDTNMKWKNWFAQPEARYWFCRRFGGHFLAMHALGGQYNVGNIDNMIDFLGTPFSKLADYRYEGAFVGAGVGYGYAFMLGEHWNLEAEICIGGAYTWFDKYYCPKCGEKVGSFDHIYWGPTKIALNLVYVF
jgi:hypothetical protein